MITTHARLRMVQRGFNEEHIHLIMQYGRKKRVGNAVRFILSKKRSRMLQHSGIPLNILDKCKGSFVVAEGSTIITIAHIH